MVRFLFASQPHCFLLPFFFQRCFAPLQLTELASLQNGGKFGPKLYLLKFCRTPSSTLQTLCILEYQGLQSGNLKYLGVLVWHFLTHGMTGLIWKLGSVHFLSLGRQRLQVLSPVRTWWEEASQEGRNEFCIVIVMCYFLFALHFCCKFLLFFFSFAFGITFRII